MDEVIGLQRPVSAERIFHILVVDDDRVGAELLRTLMRNLRVSHQLHFVWDGVEALDFLRRRGAYASAPTADLILLDLNMPRLSGLETLSELKSDPELYVIPVIVLSTSAHSQDVQRSYEARANCFVQKPIDLARSVKLLEAIETFWMDFALLPSPVHSGTTIALTREEATSRAMRIKKSSEIETVSGCAEHSRLLNDFGIAVSELIRLHEQQFLAIGEGDQECARFDLLIHMANEKKQMKKYDFLRHLGAHGCSKL